MPPAAVAGCDGHRERQGDSALGVGEGYYKASIGDNPQEPSAEQANIVRLNLLRQMIDDEILQQRAAKLNLAASDEDVNAKLTEFKAPYTQEEFDKQLKQRNMTLDDLKLQIRRSLTSDQAAEQRDRIEDQHHRLGHQQLLRCAQGRIQCDRAAIPPGVDRRDRYCPRNRLATCKTTRPRTKPTPERRFRRFTTAWSTGEDFGGLAMNFSEDPNTASNGGDMGFVAESHCSSVIRPHSPRSASSSSARLRSVLPIYGGSRSGAPRDWLRHLQAASRVSLRDSAN